MSKAKEDSPISWAEARKAMLTGAKTLVIKVGSAVLADACGLNLNSIASLAEQIAWLRNDGRRVVLVSSGSVAAGKAALRERGKTEFANYDRARHAIAAIGQSLLMRAWNDAFAPRNILTGQVLLTRDDLRLRNRFQIAAATFSEMLAWNVLPIVNENDTVSTSELKFGDNDFLASLLVNLTEADLFINLTSAPGVFNANPDVNPQAEVMACIESIATLDIDGLCGLKTGLGSGGMRSKLLAARRVAQLGVPTLILPGRSPNVLIDAFNNKTSAGTWIHANKKSIPRRKFWLAYQSEPAGAVEIDNGAAEALLTQGSSLLPGGIAKVAGEFAKGALIQVTHDNQNLGVGFSNYSSDELKKISGLKRHEVAAILGKARYPDVIHRDNMLLDASI